MPSNWTPALVIALRHYSSRLFFHDVVAGVTVGLVALPLAMAFAIASGLTPQSGIYCAIVTGFIISALGGSRYQIGGPTGAFVVVIAGIVAEHGVSGLFMCTMMAGVMLVILGATGMGTAVKYLPRPVVIGFTNGIAVLIASTQIKDFLGLRIDEVPAAFVPRLQVLARNLHTMVALGGAAWRRRARCSSWSCGGACRRCPAPSSRCSAGTARRDGHRPRRRDDRDALRRDSVRPAPPVDSGVPRWR